MAILNMRKSLNPRPPVLFDFINILPFPAYPVTFFHCRPADSTNTFAIMPLICSHMLLVKSKQDIVHVGMAWATALTNISFPTLDRSFSSYPCILFQMFSLMYSNSLLFAALRCTGKPKYRLFLDFRGMQRA